MPSNHSVKDLRKRTKNKNFHRQLEMKTKIKLFRSGIHVQSHASNYTSFPYFIFFKFISFIYFVVFSFNDMDILIVYLLLVFIAFGENKSGVEN